MTRGVPGTLASACFALQLSPAHAADARRGREDRPAETRSGSMSAASPRSFISVLGDRTPRLFQRARDRCGDPDVRSGTVPCGADRRQRRRGRGDFRPHDADARQGRARCHGAAIRALSSVLCSALASKAIAYAGPPSLKGLKIGLTSPGSTRFMAAYMLVRSGFKADDASFIGIGLASTAVAAAPHERSTRW